MEILKNHIFRIITIFFLSSSFSELLYTMDLRSNHSQEKKSYSSFNQVFMKAIQNKIEKETSKNQQGSPKKNDRITIDFNLGDIFNIFKENGYTQEIVGTFEKDSSETFPLSNANFQVTVIGFDKEQKKFGQIIISLAPLVKLQENKEFKK